MAIDSDLIDLISRACAVRSAGYTGLHDHDEFNAAGLHSCDLIRSAAVLLDSGFHAPAAFMAITAMEEIAKIKIGHARSWGTSTTEVKRARDPLFNHSGKHKLAFDPVLLIGTRLAETIGKARVEEIFGSYGSGSQVGFRESTLYFSRDSNGLKLPKDQVSRKVAIEHILIAIEMFDDFFYFMTAEVSVACEELNELFDALAQQYRLLGASE